MEVEPINNSLPFVFNDFENVETVILLFGKAVKKVLPKIMKENLTLIQYKCCEKYFFEQKTQKQIADELEISQPTVCRHLKGATKILLNRLNCAILVSKEVATFYTKLINSDY